MPATPATFHKALHTPSAAETTAETMENAR